MTLVRTRNRLFHGLLASLTLSGAACASSAIQMDDDPSNVPDGTDGELDGGDDVGDVGDVDSGLGGSARDSGAKDAGHIGDGGLVLVSDAGRLLDGGNTGTAGNDAATAPAKDAATPPPVVDASTPPPPLMCTGNTGTACSGQCVDLRSDAANCGNCAHKCAATETCSNSACMAATQPSQVPNGCTAKSYGGHTYAFCTQTREWTDARSSCLSANLDLTIVTDKDESDFVKGNGESWIGETDLDKEGSYVDVVPGNAGNTNGAAATYENWSNGNPSNSQTCDGINIFVGCLGKKSDEDCLMIAADGTWNDDLCTRSKRYVCESY